MTDNNAPGLPDWRRQQLRGQWSLSWLFPVVFHQLIPLLFLGAAFNSGRIIFIIIYFGIVSFLFTTLFLFIPAWVVAILIFFFGAIVEPFLFGVVQDFLLAGLFYVFLLALPYWLARWIWKPGAAAP
jgi:hypothetical protein